MAEMLVDSTKLDACLDAEADAIRAKTGDSNDLTFDFANNKGFADAIAAIPSGGGGSEVVTVGANSVSNMYSARNYLVSLSSLDLSSNKYLIEIESGYESPIYNQVGAIMCYSTEHVGIFNIGRRYRNGWLNADLTTGYDGTLVVGSTYKVTVLG